MDSSGKVQRVGDSSTVIEMLPRSVSVSEGTSAPNQLGSADSSSSNSVNQQPWTPYEHGSNKASNWTGWMAKRWQLALFVGKRRWFLFGFAFSDLLLAGLTLGLLGAQGSTWSGGAAGSGEIPEICMILVFVLGMRNSIQQFLFTLAYERGLRWHIYLGYVTVAVSIFHGFHAMYKGKGDGDNHGPGGGSGSSSNWSISDSTNLTGWISTIAMFGLYLTSFEYIRRHLFEVFMKFHWILFIVAGILAIIHGAGAVAAGMVLWGLDVLYREYREIFCLPREATVSMLPGDILRLTFPKGDLEYQAGQYIFVCVPGVSRFQYHPFSFSSSPYNNQVSIHLRALGNWTKQLVKYAENKETVRVLLDGPCGEVGVDVLGPRYEYFILLSGGIGITPMQSVCNTLINQAKRGRPLKKVVFIWSVRDLGMVDSMMTVKESPTRAASFVPDLLHDHVSSMRDLPQTEVDHPGHFLHTAFHLTNAKETTASMIRESNAEVSHMVHFGRPDLSNYFRKTAELANGAPVAVLVCGPSHMVQDARLMASSYSNFDFHNESFEF